MNEQPTAEYRRSVPADPYVEEYQGPGLMDGIRFLYRRRLKLAGRFIAIFGIALIGFLYFRLTAPTIVQGTLALTFRGIERNEYPSGRQFSVEDFRSPDLLTKALSDADIPKETIDARSLAARLYVTPVIPQDIQARWKKQEKDGTKKDEYYPSEFSISIEAAKLNNAQRLRVFDAVVNRYRERVKFEQESALSFVTNADESYEKLAKNYDFWDIPALFQDYSHSLGRQLTSLITEALQYQDSKYQLAFRNISRDLNTWSTTRLQALEALTYEGRLVKNREIVLPRVQYRIDDMDIQIKQKSQEASEAERLLGIIDRPRAALAGQLNTERGLPMVDINALDKLIKSDYVGPVVERISKLQEEIQTLDTEKARLQRQLTLLPKASNVNVKQLPQGYQDLVQTLSTELDAIIQNFNRLLDEYLTATITSLVIIKQSPIITREGPSPFLVLAMIVFLSIVLAISLLSVEHLFEKLKEPARLPSH